MRKIRLSVLERMEKAKLTGNELDMLLCICNYQDDAGRIPGVYYKDICSTLGLSFQGFYNALYRLRDKGIIALKKADRTDWDVRIIGNDCRDAEGVCREGYLSLADGLFANKDFCAMKANEKLLAMRFLVYCRSGQRSYQEGKDKLLTKLKELLGCGLRAIRNYFTTLRKLFSIGIKDKKFFITIKRGMKARIPGSKSDAELECEHKVKSACSRSGVKSPEKQDIADVAALGWRQYRQQVKELQDANWLPDDYFTYLIRSSLVGKEEKLLEPKYIHKLLRSLIEKFEKRNEFATA